MPQTTKSAKSHSSQKAPPPAQAAKASSGNGAQGDESLAVQAGADRSAAQKAMPSQADLLNERHLEELFAVQRAQMEAFTKAAHAFMEGLTEINREVIGFGDQRARAMMESSNEAPKKGGWEELWSFQCRYASHATQAYLEEATKLFDLGVKISQESLEPIQESMQAAMKEMKRKDV